MTDYYAYFEVTSAATPIVAGVAALMLEADSTLTLNDLYDIITETADDVGPYRYTSSYSDELAYGRVNACAALQEVIASKKPIKNQDWSVFFNNPVMEVLSIRYSSEDKSQDAVLEITNIMGQSIEKRNVSSNDGNIQIPFHEQTPGLYILNIRNGQESVSYKIIKL